MAGADVTLLLPPPPGQDHYVWPLPLRQARSDADGKFAFEGLPPGTYRVWANHEKLTSRRATLRGEQVVVPEGGEQPKAVELRMFPGVAVTARVKSQATGKPIPKAIVHFGWSDLKHDNFATDREGCVTLQPLTKQRWFIEAWADGFARQSQWINLESGSDADVEFSLGAGGDIEGTVRDPMGNAISGVGVSVREEGDRQQLVYVTTDDKGRYRLTNLPLGTPLQISLSKLDYLRQTTTASAAAAKQNLDLTIHPRPHGGSIVGVVLDQARRRVADAELANQGTSSIEVRRTRTGKDGRFRLENLYEALHGPEVTVRARKYAPQHVKVTPGPADKPTEVEIVLEPGHTLRGRVEDEAGHPLEGVAVYFANGDSSFDGGKTITNKHGQFELDSLPADSPMTFSKSGFSQIDDRKLPLDTPDVIVVKMTPSGAIQGVVIDAKTGRPVRSFNVRITFSPNWKPGEPSGGLPGFLSDPGQRFQSDEGKFQITDLLLGMPLQVMVDSEGYEREVWERVVADRGDQAKPVEFRLVPVDPANRSSYGGRFRDALGKPVAGAVLRLIAARDRKPGTRTDFPFNWEMIRSGQLAQQSAAVRFLEGKTDAEGRFEFHGIPNDCEVELAWWGKAIVSGRIDHLERFSRRTAIDIDLPAPGRIKATVDRERFPMVGTIQIRSDNGANESRQLTLKPEQGTFEVGDLAAGSYTVYVMSPSERVPGRPGAMTSKPLAHQTVAVEAGETVDIEFDQ